MSCPQSAPCPQPARGGALPKPRRRTEGGKFLVSRGMGRLRPQGKKVGRQGCGDGPDPVQIRPEEDAGGEPGSDFWRDRLASVDDFVAHENGSLAGDADAVAVDLRPSTTPGRQGRRQEPRLPHLRRQGRAGGGLEEGEQSLKERPFGQAWRPILRRRSQCRRGRSRQRPGLDLVAPPLPARGLRTMAWPPRLPAGRARCWRLILAWL